MRAPINNGLIAKLKPQEKQYDVRDTKLNGFMIRITPKGKMSYVCQYQRGRRINIGDVGILTPTQARDRATEILADAIKGIAPTGKKKVQVGNSLKLFIENEYAPWVMVNRKDGIRTLARIKRCFYKLLSHKPLDDITPAIIDQWRTQRMKDGRKSETVNRDIATFKAALSKAVLWGFIEKNPIRNLSLLKVDPAPKVRYLNKDEEMRLRHALNVREENIQCARISANQWRTKRGYELLPELANDLIDYIKPMVFLSLNTGMRQGEIFNLKWQDIDFDRRILSVSGEYTKSSKTRHIPLNDEAFNVLMQWRAITMSKNLVFESKEGKQFNNVRKSWLTLLKLAEIQNFRWHDTG